VRGLSGRDAFFQVRDPLTRFEHQVDDFLVVR
jgi:hypothetical protein